MVAIERNPWGDKDAPFETLSRPARMVTSRYEPGQPGAVIRPAVPVQKSRSATAIAKSKRDEPIALDYVPVTLADGVVVESARMRGRTVYRRVRTLDMGDEPLAATNLGAAPRVEFDGAVPARGDRVRKARGKPKISGADAAHERALAAQRALSAVAPVDNLQPFIGPRTLAVVYADAARYGGRVFL